MMQDKSLSKMCEALTQAQRIVIVGVSCSGKSTLGRRLSGLLELPHVELDALYWRKGWEPAEEEPFRGQLSQKLSGQRWVVEGNYSMVRDIVWGSATTWIWLNYSPAIVGWRAITRTCSRVFKKEKLYGDNRETFRQAFMSRESILLWVLKSYGALRKEYRQALIDGALDHLTPIELSRPSQTENLLKIIERGRSE